MIEIVPRAPTRYLVECIECGVTLRFTRPDECTKDVIVRGVKIHSYKYINCINCGNKARTANATPEID